MAFSENRLRPDPAHKPHGVSPSETMPNLSSLAEKNMLIAVWNSPPDGNRMQQIRQFKTTKVALEIYIGFGVLYTQFGSCLKWGSP